MAGTKDRWRRILIRLSVTLIIIVAVIILISSPLVKYLAEKHDLRYTGREINIGRVYLNPFAGVLKLKNLIVYEENSDSVFLSVRTLRINIEVTKLISGVYEISSLSIDRPEVSITRDDTLFNFSDLVEKFAVTDTLEEEILKLNILNIRLNEGTIIYNEKNLPVRYSITDINFRSKGKRWDSDSITGEFSMNPGNAGANGNFMFDTGTMDYKLSLAVNNLDMELAQQYLKDISDDAIIHAEINLDIEAAGNFENPSKDLIMRGRIEADSFYFGRGKENRFASFDRFLVEIGDVDLSNNRFHFDSIFISRPYIKYELYDTLDNFRRMLRPALPVAEDAAEEVDSAVLLLEIMGADYSVKSFDLNDGTIVFNDYSIAEKFTFVVDQFNIEADSIDKSARRVGAGFNGRIAPYGKFVSSLSVDPKNKDTFRFTYDFTNIPATMFNPYITTFSSHQLDRGTIEMHGEWNVRNENIQSLNHFLIIDPRDTKRVRGKDTKWVPLPLIMSFVRERGGVIDYQIPVKGNLKDPKFKLWDIVTDLVRNILVKPPTTPYQLQVRNVEQKIEKTLTVKWRMRQNRMEKEQERFVEKVAGFLKDNEDARIVIRPVYHEAKEKENILFFEAKKKYFIEAGRKKVEVPISGEDSMKIERLSSKDPDFVKFMDKALGIEDPMFLTLQEKCYMFIGRDPVNEKYRDLMETRKKVFLEEFKRTGTENRVEFLEAVNQVPFNWFSHFRIDYKGEVPEYLADSFDKLYDLNTEPPREEFLNLRRDRRR